MAYVLIAVWLVGAAGFDAGAAALSTQFDDKAACERASELLRLHSQGSGPIRPPFIACFPKSSAPQG